MVFLVLELWRWDRRLIYKGHLPCEVITGWSSECPESAWCLRLATQLLLIDVLVGPEEGFPRSSKPRSKGRVSGRRVLFDPSEFWGGHTPPSPKPSPSLSVEPQSQSTGQELKSDPGIQAGLGSDPEPPLWSPLQERREQKTHSPSFWSTDKRRSEPSRTSTSEGRAEGAAGGRVAGVMPWPSFLGLEHQGPPTPFSLQLEGVRSWPAQLRAYPQLPPSCPEKPEPA